MSWLQKYTWFCASSPNYMPPYSTIFTTPWRSTQTCLCVQVFYGLPVPVSYAWTLRHIQCVSGGSRYEEEALVHRIPGCFSSYSWEENNNRTIELEEQSRFWPWKNSFYKVWRRAVWTLTESRFLSAICGLHQGEGNQSHFTESLRS